VVDQKVPTKVRQKVVFGVFLVRSVVDVLRRGHLFQRKRDNAYATWSLKVKPTEKGEVISEDRSGIQLSPRACQQER